jgi:hypothetical protein
VGDEGYFDLSVGDDVVPFSGTFVQDIDGQRQLLLAGRSDDDRLLYGSSRPGRPIPGAQTMLHGGDLIRALTFELPITFDRAYESDLEPLGPYWRLRHIAPSDVANAFDVVMTVDDAERLDTATVSFGPVHRTQLEPVPDYLVTVRAIELLDVVQRLMGVLWEAD